MSLAATMLEDQEFIRGFLNKSQTLLLQNRLLAEELLKQAGIDFDDKGYVLQASIYLKLSWEYSRAQWADGLIYITTAMQDSSSGLI